MHLVCSFVQRIGFVDGALHGCETQLTHVEGEGQELNELDPVLGVLNELDNDVLQITDTAAIELAVLEVQLGDQL